MPFQDGARVTLWTFDDRGSYGLADASTQTKVNGRYETDFTHRCLIVDQAYEALKGVDLPEKKDDSKRHVVIHIADGKYKRTLANGTEIDQAPISIQKKWNREQQREDWTVKIWSAEIVKGEKSQDDKPAQTTEDETPTPQPASNGLVGLDFLNIPDNNAINLPFK